VESVYSITIVLYQKFLQQFKATLFGGAWVGVGSASEYYYYCYFY